MYKIETTKHGLVLTILVTGYFNQDAGNQLVELIQQRFESGSTKHLVFNFPTALASIVQELQEFLRS